MEKNCTDILHNYIKPSTNHCTLRANKIIVLAKILKISKHFI